MTKIQALQYLVDNSVYGNEWQGAGMWEAVRSIMENTNDDWAKETLDMLLKRAEDF
jgi:hypothetical protein